MSPLKRILGWIKGSSAQSRRFENYHIMKILHEGEKSAVYQVRSAVDQELYVVKSYKPHYNQVANRLCRRYHVRPEGQIGLSINPAPGKETPDYPIVRTLSYGYEFNNPSKCYYIVLEYIDGFNLKNLVGRDDVLTRAQRLGIALTVANALAIIHERGLIHRDICADNVLVAKDGQAKLVDLGFMAPQGLSFREQTGTPSYMSPEQFEGKALHTMSDIYSFGALLFELFTGRLPFLSQFAGDRPQLAIRRKSELMDKHLRDPAPRPSEFADVPMGVERVVMRSLEKEPRNRYPNMREIIQQLMTTREKEGKAHGPGR